MDSEHAIKSDTAIFDRFALGSGSHTVAVKDCIDIVGRVTSMGAKPCAKRQAASANADVVDQLLANDVRIIGKANMHPLAFGVTGFNEWLGTPVNPNYPDRIPGGSSSGSASAVAFAQVEIGIGTDTGGSVRMPAACCGVVGFKPTFGRISRAGVHPAVSSLDCVGPLAASVTKIELAMSWLSPTFKSVEFTPGRIAFLEVDCAPEVSLVMERLSRSLPFEIERVQLPLMDEAPRAGLAIIAAESWAAAGSLVQSEDLQSDVRTRLQKAAEVTPDQLQEAETIRAAFNKQVDGLWSRFSALMLPSLPMPAPTIAEADDPSRIVPLTQLLRPFNLSGHPSISLPLETDAGAPFGLQLVGPLEGDAHLCAIAREFEKQLEICANQESMT